ncbi:MAG: hypothetical protein M1816_000758 [Peltula sp. TS41687]|nr:MAG: hypothetical protein M1816_000758 [Peltula sp. TS41687]
MPGQKASGAGGPDNKRHLMRWTVEHDQRLLLCIQYVCSEKGVKLPWEEIAKRLDDKATEGAVLQHLSKVRAKLVQQNQEVPPLRRGAGTGGSARTSDAGPTGYDASADLGDPANLVDLTNTGGPANLGHPAIPAVPAGLLVLASSTGAVTPALHAAQSTKKAKRGRARKVTRKVAQKDDDEEEEGVEDERAASDDDYTPVPAKRAKRASGRRQSKVSTIPPSPRYGLKIAEDNQQGQAEVQYGSGQARNQVRGLINAHAKSQKQEFSQKKTHSKKIKGKKSPVKNEMENSHAVENAPGAADETSEYESGPEATPNRPLAVSRKKVVVLSIDPDYTSAKFPQGLSEFQDDTSTLKSEACDSDEEDKKAGGPQGVPHLSSVGVKKVAVPQAVPQMLGMEEQKVIAPQTGMMMYTANISQDNSSMDDMVPLGIDPAEMADFAGHGLSKSQLYNPMPYPSSYGNMGSNAAPTNQGGPASVGAASGQQTFGEGSSAMQGMSEFDFDPNSFLMNPGVFSIDNTMNQNTGDSANDITLFNQYGFRQNHNSQVGFAFPNAGFDETASNAVGSVLQHHGSLLASASGTDPYQTRPYFDLGDPQVRNSPFVPVALAFNLRPVQEAMSANKPPEIQDPAQLSTEHLDAYLYEDMTGHHDGAGNGLGDGGSAIGSGSMIGN